MNKALQLLELGQSLWFDSIRRGMLHNGEMEGMIARGEILLKQKAPFAPIRISADKLLLDDDNYEYMDESED